MSEVVGTDTIINVLFDLLLLVISVLLAVILAVIGYYGHNLREDIKNSENRITDNMDIQRSIRDLENKIGFRGSEKPMGSERN